jgi:diguanylate cyclase (GGDEF)-like protein
MITLAKNIQHLVDFIVSKAHSQHEEEIFRLNHYVWIALLMLPVAIGSGAYNVYIKNYALAFLVILFSGHMLGSLFLIPTIKRTYLLYHGANLLYTFLLLYMVFHTDAENSRILWAYIYPVGIIFLFGHRLGFLWSFLLLCMMIGLFLFVPEIHTIYSIPFQVRFGISYLVVAIISSWVEYHGSRSHQALLLEQKLLNEEIERRKILEYELQRLAQTDPLTSLYNRGFFLELAEKELKRAKRYNTSLCFAILDIDYFKRINDTFGHPIGDTVLQALAKQCLGSLRETDLMGRLGGEEFAFLLLHVNEEQARAKMEKLKNELSQLSVADNAGSTFNFTVSIGLVMLSERIEGLDELYIQADEKLYVAKDAGRNCVR